MPQTPMKHGDFSALAVDYARYRPGYAPSVLTSLLALVGRPPGEIDAVDVGAGTGIWTMMLAARGLKSVTAVEPNEEMRQQGILATQGCDVSWRKGAGEATGLGAQCCDLVSMASSFHWVDFDRGCTEFQRVLRPGGWFVALWNPRLVEANPLLVEIESEIVRLKPDIRRVSSGRSGLTERLTELLWAKPGFDDVVYLEGRHVARQTPEQYLGVWRSVNDLQVQLGPDLFRQYLDYIERKIAGLPAIETTYVTRAWAARRS
ncbi:MAG TPA: class I SAM-dependent methyltransferase [Stellaceae bacterium]|nr:class I SAM-dependent methyltransferase [Stellaceae bacterium]